MRYVMSERLHHNCAIRMCHTTEEVRREHLTHSCFYVYMPFIRIMITERNFNDSYVELNNFGKS
jgi:hypothetical protein